MLKIPESMKALHPLSDTELYEFAELNKIEPFTIYSRDEYKDRITSHRQYFCINLDDEDGMGTHWTGLYSEGNKCYYYDSFGLPCPTEIMSWVKDDNDKELYFIDNQHQALDSEMCGYFVCYFLYSMKKNMQPEDYAELFGDVEDGAHNDEELVKLFHIKAKMSSVNRKAPKIPKVPKTRLTAKMPSVNRKATKAENRLKGEGFDIVEKINKIFQNVEFHLRDVTFNDLGLPVGFQKHSFTGPNTDLNERIGNLDELMQLKSMEDITYDKIKYNTPPIDTTIDRGASIHDLMYSWGQKHSKTKEEKLENVHKADKILQTSAFDIMKSSKNPIQKRIQGALVSLTMLLKRKLGFGMDDTLNGKCCELDFLKKHNKKINKVHNDYIKKLMR